MYKMIIAFQLHYLQTKPGGIFPDGFSSNIWDRDRDRESAEIQARRSYLFISRPVR